MTPLFDQPVRKEPATEVAAAIDEQPSVTHEAEPVRTGPAGTSSGEKSKARELLASSTREQKEFVLEKPRQAIAQARGRPGQSWDPRLSTAGNRAARQLAWLLDNLARMENWLRHRGRGELSLCDSRILTPGFERLAHDSRIVGELVADLAAELKPS